VQYDFPIDSLPVDEVYARLSARKSDYYCFESLPDSGNDDEVHRFTYIGAQPLFIVSACNDKTYVDGEEIDTHGASPLSVLNDLIKRVRIEASGDVPEGQHFSGGFVGCFTYEATQYGEPAFMGRTEEGNKTFALGYFPDGLVYDRMMKRYYYYTRGPDRRAMFRDILRFAAVVDDPSIKLEDPGVLREEFEEKVRRILEWILAGDVFQVVLSRRETYDFSGSEVPLYRRLRRECPSHNMHAISIGGLKSMGSFPEFTLRVTGDHAFTYPIAGTRIRTGDEAVDAVTWTELINDEKERAEHIMLVDLGRSDIGRVSEFGTVRLAEIMGRRDAGNVMHIASQVSGKLRDTVAPLDALMSIAPMGTVSGAPKVEAMKKIYVLEPGPRGLYAGCVGYVDAGGNQSFVANLRSLIQYRSHLIIQAGAGIVADSVPRQEYDETEGKMGVPRRVIEPYLSRS
jgi:anthranilate synthase component 1